MTPYELRVKGGTALDWADWFRELEVRPAAGDSEPPADLVLTTMLPDQSALLGVLMRLHNLNLTIFSVKRLEEP